MDLSIVIPAYNEAHRLAPTVERIAAHVACEIIVVDDGSTDGTAVLARRLARRHPGLRVIRTFPNRGKGHAVRTGMLAARGALRVMWDADGSMPPEELSRLVAAISGGGADVAIASRYVDGAAPHGQPGWRRAWSRLCNRALQATLLPGIHDSQCGYKLFTAAAARELFAGTTATGWAFDVEILALARRRGLRVVEVGVAWRDDPRSRVRPARDLFRVVAEAARIRRIVARAARGALPP